MHVAAEVVSALVRQEHELEAAVRATVAGMHVRPRGIAPLARARQVRQRTHVIGPQVDGQPALGEAEVGELDARGLTHDRARAIRADHVPRPHGGRLVRRLKVPWPRLRDTAQRERHMVARVNERLGAPTPVHDSGRQRLDCAVQRRLEVGLKEQVPGLPAGGARRELDAEDRLAVGAKPVVGLVGHQIAGDLVDDPDLLPHAHDLVVEVDRARPPVQLTVALINVDAMTAARQQRSRGLAHRAIPHDQHVGVERRRFCPSPRSPLCAADR